MNDIFSADQYESGRTTRNVLALFGKRYKFKDEKTGEEREGASLQFSYPIPPECGDNRNGREILSGNIPYDDYDKLGPLPCMVEVQFEKKAKKTGRSSEMVDCLVGVVRRIEPSGNGQGAGKAASATAKA